MIRIMVGTILDIAKNEIDLTIKEILDKQDRQYAGKLLQQKDYSFWGQNIRKKIILIVTYQIYLIGLKINETFNKNMWHC